MCVSSNLNANASIDKDCDNRLDNLGYSFFTALNYDHTDISMTSTSISKILANKSYYLALFQNQQQNSQLLRT